MVRINNSINFPIYDLDTPKSVIERIAENMKTIPKYIYFIDGTPTLDQLQSLDNINVEDLLSTITNKDIGYNFNVLFTQNSQKFVQNDLDIRKDVLDPFVAYNSILEMSSDQQMRGAYFLMMDEHINNANIFDSKINTSSIWDNRVQIKNRINTGIETNKASVKIHQNMINEFLKTKKSIKYTEFELERVKFEFKLDMTDTTIMEIFNRIQLNPTVPFACINEYYKILKDFIPYEDWWVFFESNIIFKVLQKKNISDNIIVNDYSDAILAITNENGKHDVSVSMSLKTSGHYLNKKDIIERFLDTINGDNSITVQNIVENNVNGVFYIPNHDFNKYIFADIAMNNPIFSTLLSIDESEKATRKKDSIYIHFFHSTTGNITANLTQKISIRKDPSLRGKDTKKDFPFGSKYIRVKISSANDVTSVENFQTLFMKLLAVYDSEYEMILNIYKMYLPNFIISKDIAIEKGRKLKLKDIAPEVFVIGYPPKCLKPPTIIDDEEVKDAEKQGKVVMKYSKDSSEGFPSRNYICNYPDAKYPSLRNNPLSNKHIVPYLPCCYKKDHKDKVGSIFRHYYFGEDIKTKVDAEQQDLIITNKFVPKDKYGTIPEDMSKLFNIFDYDMKYMYVRKGVYDTKSSFLNCVMEGMYDKTNILGFDDKEEVEAQLYQLREKLATDLIVYTTRQEMYDFNMDEVQTTIMNPDIYFDPKLFIPLLEEYYDCNIYVFSRRYTHIPQLVIPKHNQGFYNKKRSSRSIFIYEHLGSTSDHATHPRCELIVKWKIGIKADVTYYSPYSSKLSKGINSVFKSLTESYILNIPIEQTIFPMNNDKISITNQGIDSYGKCRLINIVFNNNICTILTNPIAPLAVKETKEWNITRINTETLLQITQILNIQIIAQITNTHGQTQEILGKLGNVHISIPITDSKPISNIEIVNKSISYPNNEISVLQNYNRNKKLARYITEYLLWLFSHYLNDTKVTNVTTENIIYFRDNFITIDPEFQYGYINKLFSKNNNSLMKDKKIVVKSEEVLKRLLYVLRIHIQNNITEIQQYYTHVAIKNYYIDITDFDHHEFQVILYGEQSVQKWIEERKIDYIIHDTVKIGKKIPYFFRNNLINNSIYLAQNTINIYEALGIAVAWNSNGYNEGEHPVNIPKNILSFTLYSYVNSDDIKEYSIQGEQNPYDIKILGYKIGKSSFYTVLLPL